MEAAGLDVHVQLLDDTCRLIDGTAAPHDNDLMAQGLCHSGYPLEGPAGLGNSVELVGHRGRVAVLKGEGPADSRALGSVHLAQQVHSLVHVCRPALKQNVPVVPHGEHDKALPKGLLNTRHDGLHRHIVQRNDVRYGLLAVAGAGSPAANRRRGADAALPHDGVRPHVLKRETVHLKGGEHDLPRLAEGRGAGRNNRYLRRDVRGNDDVLLEQLRHKADELYQVHVLEVELHQPGPAHGLGRADQFLLLLRRQDSRPRRSLRRRVRPCRKRPHHGHRQGA